MIEHFVTDNGFVLALGCVKRQEIDLYTAKHPCPQPPIKTAAELGIAVFGEGEAEKELVEVWDDPDYLDELKTYHLSFYDRQLGLIAPAVVFLSDLNQILIDDMIDLATLPADPTQEDLLRFVVLTTKQDAVLLVETILYNSTVTNLGMLQAAARFDVRWKGVLVPINAPENSPLHTSREFGDRQAAIRSHIAWPAFCELTGPEQSAIVAMDRISTRLILIQRKTWKT